MTTLPAWAVHVLTASGAALAVFAAAAAAIHLWQLTFLLLGLALLVDGLDGPLARALKVDMRLPQVDGVTLDLVVDYTTYVFVPALILIEGPLLAPPFTVVAGVVVTVVGALYFADRRMKTAGLGFRGFPAVWNAVVFQLMVYKLPEAASLAVLGACAVATFTAIQFVHPLRVRRWRPLTLTMTLVWGLLAGAALATNFSPPAPVIVAFALVNLYFAGVGAVQQLLPRHGH